MVIKSTTGDDIADPFYRILSVLVLLILEFQQTLSRKDIDLRVDLYIIVLVDFFKQFRHTLIGTI